MYWVGSPCCHFKIAVYSSILIEFLVSRLIFTIFGYKTIQFTKIIKFNVLLKQNAIFWKLYFLIQIHLSYELIDKIVENEHWTLNIVIHVKWSFESKCSTCVSLKESSSNCWISKYIFNWIFREKMNNHINSNLHFMCVCYEKCSPVTHIFSAIIDCVYSINNKQWTDDKKCEQTVSFSYHQYHQLWIIIQMRIRNIIR